jgi:hypothetical protein
LVAKYVFVFSGSSGLQLDVWPIGALLFLLRENMDAQILAAFKDFGAIECKTPKTLFSDFNHFPLSFC